ncbi:hypothetical protein JHK85_056942 [Glycine max]|nr:hypothetical protein JHK87_056188 [Glycine soja]KAG4918661.1 hypothetical protein JHK85_056942 [Glycine max]
MTSFSLNIGNFITLRFIPTNYPPWHEQALALAESQDLVGHLTNDDPALTQYTTSNSNDTTNRENFVPNLTDKFITWRKANCLLRGWIIIGTFSEEALGLVGLDTTHEDDQSISEHIRIFKDKEKNFYLLTSLWQEYETFKTTMLKPARPSYSELISQLQSHDRRCNWFSNHSIVHNSSAPQVAFYDEQQQSRTRNRETNYHRETYMFSSLCWNRIFPIVSNQDQQIFGINV